MYKSAIVMANWDNNFPIQRVTFQHYVDIGFVTFEDRSRRTIIHWDDEYHIYDNGKWLGPYNTYNEARFWLRSIQ